MKLREYQEECLEKIKKAGTGKYLIQMATGLGKTVIFTTLINNQTNYGRCLIISHREELVKQPLKYITKTKGIEMGKYTSNHEETISGCIASLIRRYKKFSPEYFGLIIVDEAHHSAANSYKKLLDYFKPKLLLGFTATPNRADSKRLDKVYDKIIYKYNLLDGIKNGYLSNIRCKRVYVKYDLKNVRSQSGDYKVSDLENELIESENPKAIAKIYQEHATGATLIFGVSVKHCEEIAKNIKGAVVVTAETKNREQIIKDFTAGKINCIVNCMIFTEGTDIPKINTIIIARPTKNVSLYTQIVGRGLRLYDGKEYLNLIDCVGVSTDLNLCTAPSLLGIDYNDEKALKKENELAMDVDLFNLPEIIEEKQDHPDNWKINYKVVNLWAKKQNYQLHNINWYKHSDGHFSLSLKNKNITTGPINELGYITFKGQQYEAQNFFDRVFKQLNTKYPDQKYIWDLNIMKSWGYKPASEAQINQIQKALPNYNTYGLNKLQASQILNKIYSR